MANASERTFANNGQSSADVLNILNKKFFGSLVEPSGVVYGTGELGNIPDIFPMLLVTIKDYISKLDPFNRTIEIDPGLGVTLEQLGQNLYGISPAAFVLFTNRLRHGSYMVGSFSPVKAINWFTAKNLVKWIADEIDELLDDLESSVDPITWRDIKYNVITEMINERAQLINYGLNSRTMQSALHIKTMNYSMEHMILTELKIDYSKVPLTPKITGNDTKFWAYETGQPEEYLNILRTVLNASIEPLRQLNRESVNAVAWKEIQEYLKRFLELPKSFELKMYDDWIAKLALGLSRDKDVKELTRRYLGIKSIPSLVQYYCDALNESLRSSAILESRILEDFRNYAKDWLIRKFCLGIITKQPLIDEIFSTMLEIFREFQIRLTSLDKQEINNAIIVFDQKITDHKEQAGKITISVDEKELKGFLEYWIEEFSGIIPEEVILLLNIGILYVFCDYQRNRLFSIFSIDKNKPSELDFASVREIAQKSTETNKLPKFGEA
jgi:hypothetical protein